MLILFAWFFILVEQELNLFGILQNWFGPIFVHGSRVAIQDRIHSVTHHVCANVTTFGSFISIIRLENYLRFRINDILVRLNRHLTRLIKITFALFIFLLNSLYHIRSLSIFNCRLVVKQWPFVEIWCLYSHFLRLLLGHESCRSNTAPISFFLKVFSAILRLIKSLLFNFILNLIYVYLNEIFGYLCITYWAYRLRFNVGDQRGLVVVNAHILI